MAYLYRNVVGREVKKHSHSGGVDWSCPRKYKLKRVDGYQSKEDGVATYFGRAVEAAIQYYHTKGFEPGSGADEFRLIWHQYKDDNSIKYTDKSGSWEDHLRMGIELLYLYEATLPELPVANAKFQVEKVVNLFDQDSLYGDLQYTAKADMICTAVANHPLLPPLQGGGSDFREFIVDIKTSSYPYPSDPRMASLDDQLRDYSWVFDYKTVAFLVLVKNHTSLESGDWFTVLAGEKVGKKYQVLDASDSRVVGLIKSDYDEYQARKKEVKGKGTKDRLAALQAEYLNKAYIFKREEVTKQRIQFLAATIPEEDRWEARQEAMREAMDISDCGERDYFPKRPGVRFPHNPCVSCDCLGLCIGDEAMVKEKLVKIDGVF